MILFESTMQIDFFFSSYIIESFKYQRETKLKKKSSKIIQRDELSFIHFEILV
jgi:hypothetical protein